MRPRYLCRRVVTALGMIDMGTTTTINTSQVSHTPEHSDACVFVRCRSPACARSTPTGAAADPDMRYPQDIMRLQAIFSSQDQLLTLALGAVLDTNVFTYAREVDVRSSPTAWPTTTPNAPCSSWARRAAATRRSISRLHRFRATQRGACSRTPAPTYPSPLPSRWQWGTACRRSRPRSTTASVRA